jgi:hypothetical protein
LGNAELCLSRWSEILRRFGILAVTAAVLLAGRAGGGQAAGARYFVDCSQASAGDGSLEHPWNSLDALSAHLFHPGEVAALKRGMRCSGALSLHGSGSQAAKVRLTAYGQGERPKILADGNRTQAVLLKNLEYWQVDSLDIAGGNTYGLLVTGDEDQVQSGITLRNLYVHDVRGGELKSKDNGLVVFLRGSKGQRFDDVLIDNVVAAHTNQWAGIMMGAGNFYSEENGYNRNVTIRNSAAEDVYGDGIILFRVRDGLIDSSVAWLTGQQPTESTGTPNAIWTWSCTDCIVRNSEAFLTDSPGVDGGAYDIDWNNTRNAVLGNYAHDTQGYCIAVFAAGYVTSDSVVRDNLCIDNGLGPRLSALQGAVYLHTWNGGVIRGLSIEHNTLIWNPPVHGAAAVIDDGDNGVAPVTFDGNRIESEAPLFYRANAQFAPEGNSYHYSGAGEARFTLGVRQDVTLAALQAAGFEKGSTLEKGWASAPTEIALRLDASVDFVLDADGLLNREPCALLTVLRSLAAQYGPEALAVTVHLHEKHELSDEEAAAEANALLDLDAGAVRFDRNGQSLGRIRLWTSDGRLLNEWNGFQTAATLGGTVRALLGAPHFAAMHAPASTEGPQ